MAFCNPILHKMRIQSVSSQVTHVIPYLQAGTNDITEKAQLPIMRGVVEELPPSLEAIVCAGDLQGVDINAQPGQEPKLLGEVLADELLILLELLSIAPSRTGIVLTGDFYSAPQADKRGASGDVRRVWNAFRQRFRWVAGVLGNHDQFGATADELRDFTQQPNLYHLEGNSHVVDGLTLAGIGGIIGKPTKPLRHTPDKYLLLLAQLRQANPDLMILHPSPAVAEQHCIGSEELGAVYEKQAYPLTVCGHVAWPMPLVELKNKNQILNVDAKAFILTPPVS